MTRFTLARVVLAWLICELEQALASTPENDSKNVSRETADDEVVVFERIVKAGPGRVGGEP